ncbi:hypothetical protein GGR34_003687 [Microvirga flocculans]|uniref:Uncharacterized protein n=1 Tax=Microvirga flocculans TaxID=217168 RepID=A0A7W6N9R4_9HYPH|nr:hypothetical protein [Microvirga flocculans]MBB4042002.1 hypothetical protein [Microvirga flocculans]
MAEQEPMSSSPEPHVKAAFLPVEGRARTQAVSLEWPFTYGGAEITGFEVHRLTVSQVEAVMEALKSGAEVSICEAMTTLPGGEPVPPGLFAAGVMDDDDDRRVFEVVQSFLPQRLRRVLGSTLLSGDATSPPSQAD